MGTECPNHLFMQRPLTKKARMVDDRAKQQQQGAEEGATPRVQGGPRGERERQPLGGEEGKRRAAARRTKGERAGRGTTQDGRRGERRRHEPTGMRSGELDEHSNFYNSRLCMIKTAKLDTFAE